MAVCLRTVEGSEGASALCVEGFLGLHFLIWKVWVMAVPTTGHLRIWGVDACKTLRTGLSLLAQSRHSVSIKRSCGSKAGFLSYFILVKKHHATSARAHTQCGLPLQQRHSGCKPHGLLCEAHSNKMKCIFLIRKIKGTLLLQALEALVWGVINYSLTHGGWKEPEWGDIELL